ncbi:methylmalonyl-CoA epimerase [Brevibacillus sp. NRS-1366]|uniref:methylmalonyl-CoA epimerase n=1 Tax=Brevibacillus sp. NRS-1366 TaxID=3233899 RepID=UPI003D25A973
MKAPSKIAHIGIAVKSLEQAIPFYTEHLGLSLIGTEEVLSEQVKVAFLVIGESRIELLEPLSDQSSIAKFIEKRGEGIHHIALDVDDVKERLTHLKEQGVPLIHEQPKEGAHNAQIGFLHPKAAGGVLYELCQYPQEDSGHED